MLGATHQEAVRALRSAGDKIQIMVCTGWASGTDSPGLSKSMSSLDREDDEYLRIQQVCLKSGGENKTTRYVNYWNNFVMKKLQAGT